jgi:MutS domain I/ATPase family associated with various cellular activities (AAA)
MNLTEKYKPKVLDDLEGQGDVVLHLKTWLANPSSAAFVFSGGTGVGKTSAALVLAAEVGVSVEDEEMGGLHQIASGEQTGESVRSKMDLMRVSAWKGSGWRCLIVNEADCMTPNAAYVWLDALEHLPPRCLVIFTTNEAKRLPRRLLDRCEHLAFESSALFMRPALERFAAKVWKEETGRTDCPDLETLGYTSDGADASFRRLLQCMGPHVRAAQAQVQVREPAIVRQWREATARHPGMIVLFRAGDFMETFGEDAELLARQVGLSLTTRSGGVAMAGFRHHQLEAYLRKLLNAGLRVAICEQIDPASGVHQIGGAKQVERIVLPGAADEPAESKPPAKSRKGCQRSPKKAGAAPMGNVPEDLTAFGERWAAGESLSAMCKETGLAPQSLAAKLKKLGFRPPVAIA